MGVGVAESYRSQLPAEFMQDDVLAALSFDAQAYFVCSTCQKEWRYNQTVNLGTPQNYVGRPCPGGDGGILRLRIHAFRQEVVCLDCDHERTIAITAIVGNIGCPRCGSHRYFPFSTRFDPPFPSSFGNLSLTTSRSHIWGVNASGDSDTIQTELEGISMRPDGPQYLIPAARFAAQLQASNEYSQDAWLLGNVEAILLNEYYRLTEELAAGIDALEIVQEVVDSPESSIERAMLQHNMAMFAYSLIARNQPELDIKGDAEHYRQIGIQASRIALASYQKEDTTSPGIRIQIARVQHTLGDLLKAGQATQHEIDEAIALLDKAIQEPSLPENLRLQARNSRATALLAHDGDLAGVHGRAAEEDFLATLELGTGRPRDKIGTLLNLANICEADGRIADALSYLTQAAALAEREVIIADDQESVRQAAGQFRQAFDSLARLRVSRNRPRAALEAIETVRAATVRFAHESKQDQVRRHNETLSWHRRSLTGDPRRAVPKLAGRVRALLPDRVRAGLASLAQGHISTDRIDSALNSLADSNWPDGTVFCTLSAADSQLSVILVYRDEAARWHVEGAQWPIRETEIRAATSGINLEPGVFRERRLERSCRAAADVFARNLTPLLRATGAKRLAISAPGLFSHIPYEALPVGTGVLGDEFDVFYLPSIVLGAELAARAIDATRPPERALAVLYGGPDLPRAREEVESLGRLWGDRLDVIDGAMGAKQDVLAALGDGYDLIHFGCHGTFDLIDPLGATLYLDADRVKDSKRLTAADLLNTPLQGSPIVTLSACSSGLTSYGLANDCTGLTGSLLRAGARGIIASRWAVYDDVAARFTGSTYSLISEGLTPQHAVSRVQRDLRSAHGIEDWAAFSYLGVL